MNPNKITVNLINALRAGYPVSSFWRGKGGRKKANSPIGPRELEKDVLYSVQVAEYCLGHLPAHDIRINGRKVLELGPGPNLGTALVLACHGAGMTAVEPNAAAWDVGYHPGFYAALRKWLARNRPLLDLKPLDRVIREGQVPQDVVAYFHGSLEDFPSIPENSMDIVFSNAVLEHVVNLETTLEELARITKPGGLNLHQIDLRFHPNYSDPLRFLLYNNRKYNALREYTSMGCGSRVRYSEYKNLFLKNGFALKGQEVNLRAEPGYVANLMKKMEKRGSNPYQNWPVEDLAVLSARLEVVKQGQA